MFGLSPFDMMMYEQPSSSYYMPTSRAAYVPSTYGQRYVYPSHRYVVPKEQPPQHIDVEDLVEDDDEVAECVARVSAAQQKLLQAELELQRQQEQLAHAKKASHLRALERERKEREEQQAAYYQAILAERRRRQQLYEQQMKLREEQMRSEFEKKQQQQRQLEQENQARARTEDEVKREFLTQLLGEMFGQQLVLRNQSIKPQQPASKQSAKPVVKPVAKSASAQPAPVKSESKVNKPSAKEQSASGKVEQSAPVKNETSFSIPVRVINSAEPSDKAKLSSSVTSRVSVPLTVNTSGPSSPVEIEDEPITPEQWNLDASDVFKADRVHTPVPSEPSSPKQTPTDATNSTPAA